MTDFKKGDRVRVTIPISRVHNEPGVVVVAPNAPGLYYRVKFDKPTDGVDVGLVEDHEMQLEVPSIPREVFEMAVLRATQLSDLEQRDRELLERLASTAKDATRNFDAAKGPGCPLTQTGIYDRLASDLKNHDRLQSFYEIYDPIIRAYFQGTGLPGTPNYFRIED